MRLVTLLLLIFILIFSDSNSQSFSGDFIEATSFPGNVISINNDWSVLQNPAGLVFQQNPVLGLTYSNKYMLSELGTSILMTTIPMRFGTIGSSICYFGTHSYNESLLTLAFSKTLFDRFNIGIKMNYHKKYVETFKEKSFAISGEIGLVFTPSKSVIFGLHIVNPTASGYNSVYEEKLNSVIKAGISYFRNESFTLTGQVDWYNYEKIEYAFETKYYPVNRMEVRAGFRLPHYTGYMFGTEIKLSRYTIDTGFEIHPVLGISSSISLLITIGEHENE
ncbi:MAG: hypothetical protein JW894_05520 [Bacteroidales bacterium]|nr:hypothetical protein [Bacteroidales bacterium]